MRRGSGRSALLRHPALNVHRAPHGLDYAREFDERAVPGQANDEDRPSAVVARLDGTPETVIQQQVREMQADASALLFQCSKG